MQPQLLALPLLVEWVILITTLAPIAFMGRFRAAPTAGIALWFAALLSAGLATIFALGLGVWSIVETWAALAISPAGSEAWLSALAVSFAPWLFLALAGISLALVNLKIEPLIQAARATQPLLEASLRPRLNFHGSAVFEIDLPVPLAMTSKGRIILSSQLRQLLSEAELDAVLWHERGHLALRHNQLKSLARFVRQLSPTLAASKALVFELEILSELAADHFALRHVDGPTLRSARKVFI